MSTINEKRRDSKFLEGKLCHPQFDESFLKEPSKVVETMSFLDLMMKSNQMEDTRFGKNKPEDPFKNLSDDVTNDNFISTRSSRRGLMSIARRKSKLQITVNTSQFTFMRQIDQTASQRAKTRVEREFVANNYRKLGNYSYRKGQYDTAIEMYTKGLDYIDNTPVLILNRACCFIKLRQLKRALIDCNFVITTLDPKSIQAWLYRSFVFKLLGDEKNFEDSITQAKRLNSKKIDFIESFLQRMRTSAHG